MIIRFWLIASTLLVVLAWVLMVPLSPPSFQASPGSNIEQLRQLGMVPKPGEVADAIEMEGVFDEPEGDMMAADAMKPGEMKTGEMKPDAMKPDAMPAMPGMAEGMEMEAAPGSLRILDSKMANMAKRTIEIEMREWGFSVPRITVAEGEIVRLVVRNAGNVPHEFMLMPPQNMAAVAYRLDRADWNLTEHEAAFERQIVMPGDSFEAIVQADQPGNWMYMCMFPYHMQLGMMGVLSTEGAPPMEGMNMGGMKM